MHFQQLTDNCTDRHDGVLYTTNAHNYKGRGNKHVPCRTPLVQPVGCT